MLMVTGFMWHLEIHADGYGDQNEKQNPPEPFQLSRCPYPTTDPSQGASIMFTCVNGDRRQISGPASSLVQSLQNDDQQC
jgi:hypothetical protein